MTAQRPDQPCRRGIQEAPGYDGPFRMARIVATFHWTDRRKRDVPNFGESLKAIIDSLRGVALVDDDVAHLPEVILRGVLGASMKGIRVVVEEMEA